LTDNPPKIFALDDAPRAELARLCRQICLTRETNPAPAASVDSELSSALLSVRETFGLTSVSEDDLIEVFRLEQERVANASVMVELLAPRLASLLQRRLSLAPSPGILSKSAASSSVSETTRPVASAAPEGPPGIADLIDGMLDQERHRLTQNQRSPTRR
jgi:hypothetical protein